MITAVAGFNYDDNGNRIDLDYYLEGTTTGDTYGIDYTHNPDNLLTTIATISSGVTSEPDYAFDADTAGDIDGMARLWLADETIHPDSLQTTTHKYAYTYDMRSQLLSAEMKDWDGYAWSAVRTYGYQYDDDGNINTETIDSTSTGTISYDGDLMTAKSGDTLTWDKNGQLALVTAVRELDIEYNWDGKMRSTEKTNTGLKIAVKYDPMGNRVCRTVTDESAQPPTVTRDRKYIVDIVGKLPTILCELDPDDSDSLENSYIYADAQILAQYAHDADETIKDRYYYVHDRLSSVRLVAGYDGGDFFTNNLYMYKPFGNRFTENTTETIYNPFQFTGQWYDEEIDQYYLRARMYDPTMMRFTTRDPEKGEYEEPLTLHRYLYCGNDSINRIDLDGRMAFMLGGSLSGNFNINGVFGGELTKSLSPALASVMGETLGQMMAYSMFILPYYAMAANGVGGTAGAGWVAAKDESVDGFFSGWSFGTMQWAAGGASLSSGTGGAAVTLDVGYSPQAQHVSDLGGWFGEVGGSVAGPGGGGIMSAGFSASRGINSDGSFNDIWLFTGSFGAGTPGIEGHAYVGRAWVQEW